MITGLKSTVKGEELKRLISLHMAKLKIQHERLNKKVVAMKAAAKEVDKELDADQEDGDPYANVSNSGKFSQARDRLKGLFRSVEELGFIHDHIIDTDEYLLDRLDLHLIGIGEDQYGY